MLRNIFLIIIVILILILLIIIYAIYSCNLKVNFRNFDAYEIYNKSYNCLLLGNNNTCEIKTPSCPNKIKDVEGNEYNTTLLTGDCYSECWMGEDLKTTKYKDNKFIDDKNIKEYKSNKYYKYYTLSINNKNGLCPEGRHVPTKKERAKASDKIDNLSEKLSLNFGGYWDFNNEVNLKYDDEGHYRSSNEKNSDSAWNLYVLNNNNTILNNYKKDYGFSIRCIKN